MYILFHLKDLKCPGCNLIKDDSMSTYCACSGAYQLKVTPKSLFNKLATLKRIAKYHAFGMLEEEVDWMLEMNAQSL